VRFHRGAHRGRAHVVEQHNSGPAGQRLVQLLQRVHLDLERVHVGGARPHSFDGGGDAAGSSHVVVLDHRAVEQAEAMRSATAVYDGLLLQGPQAGRRLSRGGDPRGRALRLGHEARRERRHATEPAEEVQAGALRSQDRSQRTEQAGQCLAGRERLAVLHNDLHGQPGVDKGGRGLQGGHAGQHARFARHDTGATLPWEGRTCDVAVAREVFLQGAASRLACRLPIASHRHEDLTRRHLCRRPANAT
jgi:hypothetical protein